MGDGSGGVAPGVVAAQAKQALEAADQAREDARAASTAVVDLTVRVTGVEAAADAAGKEADAAKVRVSMVMELFFF